ncbi:MAG: hypothetical protein A2Z71_01465 [Chloroflexi bacterium RBG_13_50_21]|nr:MAG: hypothetical protein A2Z71_01465 [Chloroflexi bacterium RBG_13_50_21]
MEELLTTKFFFPPARKNLVSRPRLLEKVSRGFQSQLLLISAPAGYGKTTLLADWHSGPGSQVPVAWLSLDEDDNDLSRFLMYLVTALGTLKAGISESVLAILQSPQPPPPQVTMTALINDLIDALSTPFALVLDDYHVINSQSVHAAMTFLLDHLPPKMHLVILTRADPPLPLPSLRARNHLTEIRAADLRFTAEEATAFLNQIMGLTLTTDQVSALETRTEGWVAGLQLAALSMQDRDGIQNFILEFTGSHHFIVDYLADEVLNSQLEPVREFLLRTSILYRLTAPLCNALTNDSDGQSTLEKLEQANLFVVPLDDERCWYRYHHLFADMLRNRLGQMDPEIIPELRIKASAWSEANGLLDEAIEYALETGDFDRALRLIESTLPGISGQGRIATVSMWIRSLPETMITRRPRLGFSLAWALFLEHKLDQVEACIHRIEQNFSPENESLYQGEFALWKGIIARNHADMDRSRDFLQRALEQLPDGNSVLRGRAWIFLGLGYLENDIKKAREAFNQAGNLLEEGDNTGLLAVLYFLTLTLILQGELTEAASASQRALNLAEKMLHWPVTSYVHLAATELLCERNELERAEQHAAQATELARLGGNTDNLMMAFLDACKIQRACGNWEKAQNLIAEAQELARLATTWFNVEVVHEQVCLFLAQGQVNAASELLQQIQTSSQSWSLIACLREKIIRARVRIVRNETQEILKELDVLHEQAEDLGLRRWSIQILCLQALALNSLGRKNESLEKMNSALKAAEKEGSIQVFLDEGHGILDLLRMSQKLGLASKFISRLLTAFDRQFHTKVVSLPELNPEVLSERELEVLRLVADGMSNGQIADALVIARGTVKKHINNIFSKLGVQRRTECVARARELKLL